jgi:acetoin utilization protein AcuB
MKHQAVRSLEDLRRLRARDVMTEAPLTVTPETRLSRVTEIMELRGIQHFPVVDGDRLVGMLGERHLRDAMPSVLTVDDPQARRHFLHVTQVRQVAEKDPHTVSVDSPLGRVISTMKTFRLGALAITEGHRLAGIITAGDLISLLEGILRGGEDPPAAGPSPGGS